METQIYGQFAKIEDSHWWYVYRRKLIGDLLSGLDIKPDAKGLEIGCGTGGSLRYLKEYCPDITALDMSGTALEFAQKKYPEFKFIQGDANAISVLFAKESFDLVFIFNVLYHQWIKDESLVLKGVSEILRPGGYLVITEPAFPVLWRKHDKQVMGKARYRIGNFKSMLSKASFQCVRATYFNSISFLPALAFAAIERFCAYDNKKTGKKVDELKLSGGLLNWVMYYLLRPERLIIRWFKRMPVGVSLLIIAKKI